MSPSISFISTVSELSSYSNNDGWGRDQYRPRSRTLAASYWNKNNTNADHPTTTTTTRMLVPRSRLRPSRSCPAIVFRYYKVPSPSSPPVTFVPPQIAAVEASEVQDYDGAGQWCRDGAEVMPNSGNGVMVASTMLVASSEAVEDCWEGGKITCESEKKKKVIVPQRIPSDQRRELVMENRSGRGS